MKYYKVVRVTDDKMTSCYAWGLEPGYPNLMLAYKIGEKTVPVEGKIFAFRTVEKAKTFKDSVCGATRILVGTGSASRIKPRKTYGYNRNFWRSSAVRRQIGDAPPKGTILLNHFTPTAIVRSPSKLPSRSGTERSSTTLNSATPTERRCAAALTASARRGKLVQRTGACQSNTDFVSASPSPHTTRKSGRSREQGSRCRTSRTRDCRECQHSDIRQSVHEQK